MEAARATLLSVLPATGQFLSFLFQVSTDRCPWALLGYTLVYGRIQQGGAMRKTAKVFMSNRSQAVRLPKEFQFATSEVYIRKEGDDVILSPRPMSWEAYLERGPVASSGFMDGIEDLPLQEREP
jgi:antitoxin VapB